MLPLLSAEGWTEQSVCHFCVLCLPHGLPGWELVSSKLMCHGLCCAIHVHILWLHSLGTVWVGSYHLGCWYMSGMSYQYKTWASHWELLNMAQKSLLFSDPPGSHCCFFCAYPLWLILVLRWDQSHISQAGSKLSVMQDGFEPVILCFKSLWF